MCAHPSLSPTSGPPTEPRSGVPARRPSGCARANPWRQPRFPHRNRRRQCDRDPLHATGLSVRPRARRCREVTAIGKSTLRYTVELPEEGGSVELAWGVDTHTGYRRRHNEDSLVAKPPIFAVADGMGGHSAGDVASKAVVTRLAKAATDQVTTAEAIDIALKEATVDISRAADHSQLGVGTTVTGAALMARNNVPHWAIFNVGDSRVYSFENHKLTQVTVDHSVVQELVDAGMISAGEAENHPDSNIITRAVGFNADPVTDYWLIPLRKGMRLLLCSDGLTKEVEFKRLEEHLAAGHPPDQTASLLVDAALAAGGRDNVTVIVVDVADAPAGDDD